MIKILFLFLFTGFSVFSQNAIQSSVQDFTNYWAFKNASISICVKDMETGETLAKHQNLLALPPASTVKLFSTASAFEILGHDYRAKTNFYTNGQLIPNGTLSGNLYIKGGGDPSLGSKYFNFAGKESVFLRSWVQELKALRITKIEGKLIVDGSSFGYDGCPDGWTWGDMGNYYGAGPSGIVLRDNILVYFFKTGAIGSTSELIRTEPKVEGLQFRNDIKAAKQSGDDSYLFGGPYSLDRFGTGTLPYNRPEFIVKGSLPEPEKQLLEELTKIIRENGIEIQGGTDYGRNILMKGGKMPNYENMTLLKSWLGNTMEEVAFHTNMKSVNLFAEQLVCLIGQEKNGSGSTESGLKEITKFWGSKFDVNGLYLKDGSGLSRNNAVSSQHLCDLLYAMKKSEKYSVFKTTLPTAGQSGTMINVCKGQDGEGRIFAKSGTMSRIKSYAGYVKSRSGKELAFAIVINNYNCSNSATVDQMEKIFNVMAVY